MQYEYFIGLRYTRAKRRNHFISFISLISIAGIALGVAALIVVLSVMNGFQRELRERILGVASHVQITGPDNLLADWERVAAVASRDPRVVGAAPYVNAQAMLTVDGQVQIINTCAEQCYAHDPETGKELWWIKHPGYSNVPRPVYGGGLIYDSFSSYAWLFIGAFALGMGSFLGALSFRRLPRGRMAAAMA